MRPQSNSLFQIQVSFNSKDMIWFFLLHFVTAQEALVMSSNIQQSMCSMSSTIFAINGYPWMTMDIQYIYIEICILFNVLRYNQCVQPLPSFIQLVWLTRGWISHSHELGCRGCDLFGLVPIAIALASGFHSLLKKCG